MLHIVRELFYWLATANRNMAERRKLDIEPPQPHAISLMKEHIHKARMEANLAWMCSYHGGPFAHQDAMTAELLFAEADRLERQIMVLRNAA